MGLHRSYIRKSTRSEVESRAQKNEQGQFLDANTGNAIEGKYDLGHKTGNEFRTEKAKAEMEGLTQSQFNDRMNNPDLYQIEDPSSNRSHQYEAKDGYPPAGKAFSTDAKNHQNVKEIESSNLKNDKTFGPELEETSKIPTTAATHTESLGGGDRSDKGITTANVSGENDKNNKNQMPSAAYSYTSSNDEKNDEMQKQNNNNANSAETRNNQVRTHGSGLGM